MCLKTVRNTYKKYEENTKEKKKNGREEWSKVEQRQENIKSDHLNNWYYCQKMGSYAVKPYEHTKVKRTIDFLKVFYFQYFGGCRQYKYIEI